MKYTKRTFENRRVRMDGNEFYECTFKNCLMEVGGVPFRWGPHNHLIDSGFTFVDNAFGLLAFLQEFYQDPLFREMIEELFANIRAGTIPAIADDTIVKKFDA